MLPAPVHIISDTHLGAAPPDVERRLLDYLAALPGRAGALVINGDLFDFWFEWKSVIPRRGFRVLAALATLRDRGVPVLWIAGNHDCWGGEVLRDDIGVDYHVGRWIGTLAGRRTMIDHGDGLRGEGDRKYRMVRPILRHPLSVRLYRALHPDLGSRLASGTANASRQIHRARDGGAGLREVAFRELAADPTLDLVVFGHSHVAALERAEGGAVYANAGSWLDDPTFVVVERSRVELRRWSGSAEGDRVHAIDLPAEKVLPQA